MNGQNPKPKPGDIIVNKVTRESFVVNKILSNSRIQVTYTSANSSPEIIRSLVVERGLTSGSLVRIKAG